MNMWFDSWVHLISSLVGGFIVFTLIGTVVLYFQQKRPQKPQTASVSNSAFHATILKSFAIPSESADPIAARPRVSTRRKLKFSSQEKLESSAS